MLGGLSATASFVLAAAAALGLVRPAAALNRRGGARPNLDEEWHHVSDDGVDMVNVQALEDVTDFASKPKAKCGVVMMAMGKEYSKIAYKVATRTRMMEVPKNWCPYDHKLNYIPVTLFSDLPVPNFLQSAPATIKFRAETNASVDNTEDLDALEVGNVNVDDVIDGVDVEPESSMKEWKGPKTLNLARHLGSWKLRWYHVQSMLNSPYALTLYLDVDALPCTAKGISRLMHKITDSDAAVGTPIVADDRPCGSTNNDCVDPHPKFNADRNEDIHKWKRFHERNAGVMVIDMKKGRPILKEYAYQLQKMAGNIAGDQFALRVALFKNQNLTQVIFPNTEVCRYKPAGSCETDEKAGCAIHHTCHFQSLVAYGLVPSEKWRKLHLSDDDK